MSSKPGKLEKYRAERERNARRVVALHNRNEKLDKLIAELENLELHSLLRGANMSYQELTGYIQSRAGKSLARDRKQEEKPHEEKTELTSSAEEGQA